MMGLAALAYLFEPVSHSTYNDDWLLLTEDVRDFSRSEGSELRELWSSFRHGRRFRLIVKPKERAAPQQKAETTPALGLGSPSFAQDSFREWNELVVEYAPVDLKLEGQSMFVEDDEKANCDLIIRGVKRTGEAHALALEVEADAQTFRVYPKDDLHLEGRSENGQRYIELTIAPPLKVQSFYVGSTQTEKKSLACLVVSPSNLSKTERSVALSN